MHDESHLESISNQCKVIYENGPKINQMWTRYVTWYLRIFFMFDIDHDFESFSFLLINIPTESIQGEKSVILNLNPT